MVLVVDAGVDPELTREAVCDALADAGVTVELVGPVTIAHAATMTYELGHAGDMPTMAREARRAPSRSRPKTATAARPSRPERRPLPPDDDDLEQPRRRGRVPRETDLAAELGLETRPAGKPRSERRVPPGGKGTTRFSAPPLRSPKSEGLEGPDLERIREGSGHGLGTVGQSPFDD